MWCDVPGRLVGLEVLERYGCRMAEGFGLTLQLVAISVALGALFGLLIACGRVYAARAVRLPLVGYVTFFRGTPLLCQLFLIYYGLGAFRPFWQEVGLWWFLREPFSCCLLAFTLNTAAYQSEIFRGAIQAVPRGQGEAAASLGLSPRVRFGTIILPQAMVLALRPLGNELIVMIKASSLASLVTLFDLMGATKLAFARSFDLSIYVVAALIYLATVEIVRRLWAVMEGRLTRHLALR